VRGWLSKPTKICLSLPGVAEIRRGVLEKPDGKKRKELELWFSGPEVRRPCRRPSAAIRRKGSTRLGAIDAAERRPGVHEAARHDCRRGRRSQRLRRRYGNEKDFAGMKIFNPLRRASDEEAKP